MEFNNYLTLVQRQTLERMAEIEREDADRCASCGGEDCVCCEYYQDRQKWKSPHEVFPEMFAPVTYDDDEDDDDYDDEEW